MCKATRQAVCLGVVQNFKPQRVSRPWPKKEDKKMGCDIHLYIEYKRSDYQTWYCFGKKINPGRHYGLFTKLAGVRDYDDGIVPVSKPKGLPEDVSYTITSDNTLWVCENPDAETNSCTTEKADRWVNQGISKYIDSKKNRVTNPDWHSHSWLTLEEFEAAISDKKLQVWKEVEYLVILDTLKSFKQNGCETRVVFWFDN